MADASGNTQFDLINSDPKSASASSSTTAHASFPSFQQPRSQNDAVSVAKATARMPDEKKSVSYAQLTRSFHELAASSDQKKSRRELVHHVFPKLAVYNSVDPSLAPSLLMLGQQCEDRTIIRYVYYYLARILSDNSSQGLTSGGGIPTPNWDTLTEIDSVGCVTRADVVPHIVNWLSAEALNADTSFHARRLQALKALTYAPSTNSEILSKLYAIIFSILEKVADAPDMRKKGIFGASKESKIGSNLQYAALSALRRLPLDLDNPLFLLRVVQGISFADPVAVRHALEMTFMIATKDPYTVALTLGNLVHPGGALGGVLHSHDVLARVSLARLCHTISRAKSLNERPDIKSQFNTLLYQLLIDPSDTVCFEAITCVLGKYDNSDRMEERALGWYSLTREVLKVPCKTDKSSKKKSPKLLIKLVMRRLKKCFRSSSRPVLHAAARVVQEMGKSRAAAFALGLINIEGNVNTFSKRNDWDHETSESEDNEDTIRSLMMTLMEVVRTTAACECVYVRAMVTKALIWMQSPNESFYELELLIASEISDPSWSPTLLNDVLLTLHARFKATPDMAVILLEIARIFATKVPGKIDADVLQLLWKTCLVGASPDGKHTALEAVTLVLDQPPPQPGSMSGITSINRVSASDPKSALALQRLVQAAVWFLGENANYAASEYAWESATPPGTALMMLDADKMVAAAGSRNPTLVCALTRLQRCTFSCSWEVTKVDANVWNRVPKPLKQRIHMIIFQVRITAAQALTTIAIRSGEPYRLHIYEFLRALAEGGLQNKLSDMHISNGEDQVASGSGLGSLLTPALKVLDEMYKAQDELINEMRNHDNAKTEWTDEELKNLYETHENLLNLVSLFCYVPRTKYLPLGPISAKLIDIYRDRHKISAFIGVNDPAVTTGISELIYEATKQQPPAAVESETFDDDLVNAWAAGLADDGLLGNNNNNNINTPAMNRVNEFLSGSGTDAPDVDDVNIFAKSSNDDMWAKTLLEPSELDYVESSSSSSPGSICSIETSSSHFGGMNYPSLFSSKSQPKIKEEYSSPFHNSYSYHEDQSSTENIEFGTALYDFTAGSDDEMSLEIGEELEIEYEVDGWFYVKKVRAGWDGKLAGLVPVLYVSRS